MKQTSSAPATAEPARPRVLVIDDDRKLCRLIREYLEPLGYDIATVHTGPDGLSSATSESWHAVILDVMLPGMDGFEVLRGIRKHNDVPVLMLTALGEEADRIVGLEIGADDYLPKTFSTRELLARLRAVTRRAVRAPLESKAEELVVGPLRVNISALTAVEFEILTCLARSRGRVKSREQLIEDVRSRDYDVYDRSIDVHIAALRRKLGDDAKEPRFIRTIRAVGYMLINPDA